jgi:Tol biopolymer transport system component
VRKIWFMPTPRSRRLLLVAVAAGSSVWLTVGWSSAASNSREATALGSIVVVGAGLPAATGIYRRYPSGRLERLTPSGEHAPAWSRDGGRIAFVRHEGPDVCPLFVMDSDGSDPHQVGQVKTDCSGVSWGPGDRRIVFGGVPGRSSTGLWIVNANGTGLRRLRAGRGATEGVHPAWSPDGRTIVFGWTGRSPHPWGRLAAVRPDGRGYRVLVQPRAGKHDDELTFPAWSRDGRRLAFVRIDHRPGRAARTIEVANARGAHPRAVVRLPYGLVGQGAPTWSPDGRLIAFWGTCGKRACVLTVPSRGGKPKVLLRNYIEPAWGP